MGFDFDAAVRSPFRMAPGLRRLAAGQHQLTPNTPTSPHLSEKLLALREHADRVLLATADFDPVPALRRLAGQAAAEHAQAFAYDGTTASAAALGVGLRGDEPVALAAGHAGVTAAALALLCRLPAPWRLPALLALAFAEDFAIVDARRARIPWLVVALPSHWAPEEKVGGHFAQVHAPVADNALLIGAAQALTQLVSGHSRWERFVWTVTPQPRLNAHPHTAERVAWRAADDEAVAAQAWWRTERQTFIPLPEMQQAVFTILVEVEPLCQAIDSPQRARRLHDALATMSPAVLRYRGLEAVRDPLLRWLAGRAASGVRTGSAAHEPRCAS